MRKETFISKEGVEITNRFFEAISCLAQKKVIRGLQTITRRYDMNYWNTCTLRSNPSGCVLKPQYIHRLVVDYGISAEWIITGEGEMFKKLPNASPKPLEGTI